MQITRRWPRSFQVFSPSLRGGLAALALSGMAVPAFGGSALAALPPATLPLIDPAHSLTGWTLAATVMMQRGEIDAADQALSHALELSPRSLPLREDAMRYAAMAGKQKEAVSLAESLPGGDLATLILAQNAFASQDWTKLRSILSHDSHHGPLMAVAAPALLAWMTVAEGDPAKAIAQMVEASALPSTRRLYLLHAAMMAEHLHNGPQAGILYRKTGSIPDDPLTLQVLYAQLYGGWLERNGHHDEAMDTVTALGVTSPLASLMITPLQHSLKGRPPPSPRQGAAVLNLQLALMLTDVIQENGMPRDPAIITLQQALFLDPSLTVARIFLADTFRDGNQISKGLAELDQIPTDNPLAGLAAQERINLAIRSNDPNLQQEALHRALALLPGNPDFLVQLAEVEDQMGHHAEAITLYTQALKASPPRKDILWPLLIGRAMAAEESGNWAMTQDDMKHALEMAPDQPEVLNFVGYANIEHNVDGDHALSLLKRAVELQPNDASIQDSYAWALLKYRADLKTALPLIIQAAEHAPNDPEIGYHLGVAYWYLGRQMEAEDQWNQSLNDNPQPQDRTLILNALQHGGPHLAAFERSR
ncbi:tetratricopeptide repeat protein [Gluconobacter morbifer]|uniref:Tetratricopeptide repeat family protein n=1 Tax=Gluconobacter morbifer G707 TaxID=1088869 RepID=G6XFK4_9PROT|nr:hypothetical protein [Gluconobacter morbifer]EHH68962.1 hypothetical protein GMO_02690 [Gluconobacter morbifer G707]